MTLFPIKSPWRAAALLLLSSFAIEVHAQQENPAEIFRNPLEIPANFSGNYGELRSNHFHGGVDLRTGGAIGLKVHAPADGYVSRVSLSPYGYGKALYITHYNGYTTVYGHLSGYSREISAVVLSKQFETKESNVDFTLEEGILAVKCGDVVAYTGNTGSSGGPHLHYEIRESASGTPLDVLARGFIKSSDSRKPEIRRSAVIGCDSVSGVIEFSGFKYLGELTSVPQRFIVATDAVDRQEGTPAALAIKQYDFFLDSTKFFSLNIGEVPFEKNRYINSLIYYPHRAHGGASMIKSYVEEGNMLRDRISSENSGIVELMDTCIHKLRIEVADYAGNRSSRTYRIKLRDAQQYAEAREQQVSAAGLPNSSSASLADSTNAESHGQYMDWAITNIFHKGSLEVTVPPAALYSSIIFDAERGKESGREYSEVWQIGNRDVPLHIPVTISIACEIPDSLLSKCFIARVDRGKEYIGGQYREGRFSAKVRNWGTYTVLADTTPPRITPALKNGAVVKGESIRFTISDALSGIREYNVRIDGNWLPAFFDAKIRRLSVNLRDGAIGKGRHKIEVEVIDNCGNRARYSGNFVK